MSLNDPANQVRVRGHQGPHPEEYHREVFKQLNDAVEDCSSIKQCREALTHALKGLAGELAAEGTRLNRLVTRS